MGDQKYEKAIEEGDSPIKLVTSAPGLYTVNLGSVLDDEDATIEIRYAQILRFENNRLRLGIPTVIAPRYGQSHSEGNLAPHEITKNSLAAKYPLTVSR